MHYPSDMDKGDVLDALIDAVSPPKRKGEPMEFVCDKGAFLAAVKTAAQALPTKSVTVALLNLSLTLQDGELVVFGTDGRVSIGKVISVTQETPGKACILGSVLLEVLNGMQSSLSNQVRVKHTEDLHLVLTSGNAVVDLHTFSLESCTLLEPFQGETQFDLPAGALKEMVKQVAYGSSSASQTNGHTDMFFEAKGGALTLVTTDSVRLVIRTEKVEGLEVDAWALVPVSSMEELVKVMPADAVIKVGLSKYEAMFSAEGVELRTRLSDKTFPNFRTILPKTQGLWATIATKHLTEAVKGVMPVAKDASNSVWVDFRQDGIRLKGSSPDIGEATRDVDAEVVGGPISLRFNGRFLLDFLLAVGTERVRWGVTKNTYPTDLYPDAGDAPSYHCVIMPITNY